MSRFDEFVALVEQVTGRPGVKKRGHDTRLLCPAHDDHHPSLDVAEGTDGQPVVTCRSHGCTYEAICAAIGWAPSSRNGDGDEWTPHGPAIAIYHYVDEDGRLLFDVCRTADKEFPQRRPDPSSRSGWRWNIDGVRRVPYRLPKVIAAVARGETVYVVEGEKDVARLEREGVTATCNSGGALHWEDFHAEALRGASTVVIADRDDRGAKHAEQVAASLRRAGASVVLRQAAVDRKGADVSDHLAAGLGLDELVAPNPLLDSPAEPSPAAAVPWFENAAQLLAEPHPGPTPFLVEDLIVEGSVLALVGSWKVGKTWAELEMGIAVATGEKAFGRFTVSRPGPVLLILEESGRAALHRRLDMLTRGRAMPAERLADLYYAANRRVRLDDEEWRQRLLDVCLARPWRLIVFDPLARVKGHTDENVQREIGPVLDFLRALRDASEATVGYVQHTGHEGSRQRGSSDLEAYWESKLTLVKKTGRRTLLAEHREAEQAGPFVLSFGFDVTTNTLRPRAFKDDLEQQVREYLDEHPTASANEVDEAIPGTRTRVLDLVRSMREGGSEQSEPLRTTPSGSESGGGSAVGAYEAPRTTPADLDPEVVRNGPNHCLQTGCHKAHLPGSWYCAEHGSSAPSEDEIERLADLARELEEKNYGGGSS